MLRLERPGVTEKIVDSLFGVRVAVARLVGASAKLNKEVKFELVGPFGETEDTFSADDVRKAVACGQFGFENFRRTVRREVVSSPITGRRISSWGRTPTSHGR